MPVRALLILFFLTLSTHAQEKHLLYMTSPDAAQPGGSGAGLLVFDINDNHKFLRRIDIPNFKEGIRGCCASAVNKKLYITTSQHRLIVFDLLTDQVAFEKVYDTGCDRAAITPDGKLLYIPSGWWMHDNNWMVVNPLTGEEVAPRIKTKTQAHNTLISPDGQHAYLGTDTTLTVINTKDQSVEKTITPVGEFGVFPFTINSTATKAYVCLGKTVGFDIADLTTGQVLTRVLTEGDPIRHRTHGIGLTPDEKQIWLSDQAGNAVFVFDNTVYPPKQIDKIPIKTGGHGWIAFSIDGKYAYTSSIEIIDTQTRKPIATFKDENNKPVSSSKYVEVVFKDNDVIKVGNQFGIGQATEFNK